MSNPGAIDVLVVGAGFGGLYALHRLREQGLEARVVEAGSGVGGTWFWNRYPGARCDVESLDYSYSLPEIQRDWEWTERYATQPEILRYIEHVADRLDLMRSITFGLRVVAATWDAEAACWRIETDQGERLAARFVILATGCLSAAKAPDLAGLADFAGQVLNTSSWPQQGVDLTGRRVGVIGTGSSAIQAIPILAEQAAELHVFQRTAAFSIPARNAPLDPDKVAALKARYDDHRRLSRATANGVIFRSSGKTAGELDPEARLAAMEDQWTKGGADFAATFTDAMIDDASNAVMADFVRDKIRQIVNDPATAEALSPQGFPIAAKRLCLDTGYYAAFNRPNVHLIDLRADPIERIAPEGVVTRAGLTALDTLIFATGFDAMTGSVLRINIRGDGGASLRERWAAGPLTYLGLMVAGFPNLFMVTGPGSPSVLSNMVASIEQHVDWIARCIADLGVAGQSIIEAESEAEDAWVAQVNALAARTLFVKGNSWYLGANVAGKPRVFMPYLGGFSRYRQTCDQIAASGYPGFSRR